MPANCREDLSKEDSELKKREHRRVDACVMCRISLQNAVTATMRRVDRIMSPEVQ